jgi:hypothetical protein
VCRPANKGIGRLDSPNPAPQAMVGTASEQPVRGNAACKLIRVKLWRQMGRETHERYETSVTSAKKGSGVLGMGVCDHARDC